MAYNPSNLEYLALSPSLIPIILPNLEHLVLYSIPDAAILLDIDSRIVIELVNQRRLPIYNAYYISLPSLCKLINKRMPF